MKRLTLTVLMLGAMMSLVHAKDAEPGAREGLAMGGAAAAAQTHFRSFLEGEFKKMETTYAMQVRLMPGGEMLKPEYGLAGAGGRNEARTIDRAKLIAAMDKAFGKRQVASAEKIDRIFKTFTFKALETVVGDFAMDPGDPVGGPDGKFHFKIEAGDVLIKAGPGKGDYLLFQMRQIDGRWQVVAEYVD